MQEALGVGAAVELVALGLELGAKLLEVVDLAVEDDDDAAVLICHGLGAGLSQVEDRQAAEAEGDAAVDKLAAHVGTTMDDAVHHLGEHLGLVIRPTDKTDKTAHNTIPSAVAGHQIESITFEYTRGRKGGRNVQAISTESAPPRHAPVTFNGYEVNGAIILLYSLRTGDWRNG